MPSISKQHPVFLNLLRIRFPIGAIVSIGHRISGVILAFTAPTFVFLFARSLTDEAGYVQVVSLLTHAPYRGIVLAMLLVLAFHLLAGLRHLLMDIGIGASLGSARLMAWAVIALTAFAAILSLLVEVWP